MENTTTPKKGMHWPEAMDALLEGRVIYSGFQCLFLSNDRRLVWGCSAFPHDLPFRCLGAAGKVLFLLGLMEIQAELELGDDYPLWQEAFGIDKSTIQANGN
jgi:hypothetical protein